jgi:hypothetical protein
MGVDIAVGSCNYTVLASRTSRGSAFEYNKQPLHFSAPVTLKFLKGISDWHLRHITWTSSQSSAYPGNIRTPESAIVLGNWL